jgi:hypothetical protein
MAKQKPKKNKPGSPHHPGNILKTTTDKQDPNYSYSGASAPRVGGKSHSKPGVHKVAGTSSNKLIKSSIKNIKKSAASPQAKRSALASYRKK